MPRLLIAALALLALLHPAPAPAQGSGIAVPHFAAPAGFSELSAETELFRRSAEEAVANGRLLHLYLPQDMARLYAEGKAHAVTRQVLVCGIDSQEAPLDRNAVELMARSAEGMFIGFASIPHESGASAEQAHAARSAALQRSLEKGTPLLVDSLRTPSAYLHTCLVHFRMTERPENVFLSMALATAVVPVKDSVLTLTASSLLGQDDPEPHLAWVKKSASDFADAIAQAGRTRKKAQP